MKTGKNFLILFTVAAVACFSIYTIFLSNHSIPSGAVSLEYPLKNGTFFVTQSGKTWIGHDAPLDKYALDIVRLPTLASFFKFRDTNLESNTTFGTPIYSPCLGKIKIVIDGVLDQPIGIKNPVQVTGNTVVVSCNGGFDVLMAHFKKNSIKVKAGDPVKIGEELGQVGNSGNSDGPHLHIQAYSTNASTGEKTPLPITFGGKYLYQWDRFTN